MMYDLKLSGNEIRLVLRSLGRYGKIKSSTEAQELARRIGEQFERQRKSRDREEVT